jgi:hypothetical protein
VLGRQLAAGSSIVARGIGFGGVVSFIFADLIVLPILDIYWQYHGRWAALHIICTFYVTMAVAGYVVDGLFGALEITLNNRDIAAFTTGPMLDYTSGLASDQLTWS